MKRKGSSLQVQIAWAGAFFLAFSASAIAQQSVKQKAATMAQLARVDAPHSGPFRADWNSLAGYRVPQWFRDAKFGIFIHWGVYSVPAFGNEWYSRNMYVQGNAAFKHQVDTYGPQAKFGYKDFIPMFRAENFDANAWLDLFVQADAR